MFMPANCQSILKPHFSLFIPLSYFHGRYFEITLIQYSEVFVMPAVPKRSRTLM